VCLTVVVVVDVVVGSSSIRWSWNLMRSIRMEMPVVGSYSLTMIARELDRHYGLFGEDWVSVTGSVDDL
jgi:hypothetical protein